MSGGYSRARRLLVLILLPALLSALGSIRETEARNWGRSQAAGAELRASRASPPAITPSVVSLGTLHVGDTCKGTPVLEVENTSRWRLHLRVSADGWLRTGDVRVDPSSLKPGETAVVTFTKVAAAPGSIEGQIIIQANGGDFTIPVALRGQVVAPSGPWTSPRALPKGCIAAPPPEPEAVPPAPEDSKVPPEPAVNAPAAEDMTPEAGDTQEPVGGDHGAVDHAGG
jgi:hypothetical protein